MNFSRLEKKNLLIYVDNLNTEVNRWLITPTKKRIELVYPSQLAKIEEDIASLYRHVQNDSDEDTDERFLPYLKLAILFYRKKVSERQSDMRALTTHGEVHGNIDSLMNDLNSFIECDWYRETTELRLPTITEFLTLETVYGVLENDVAPPEQAFDDKFGILQREGNFLRALNHSRIEASLRDIETTVAFIDIDDFKKLNSKHTESLVDRFVLPPTMRLIEAHVYSHGSAYKFGGDEYLVLLPNMDRNLARTFLFGLQDKLEKLSFIGVSEVLRVSIGTLTFPSFFQLTNLEILDAVTEAKRKAKTEKDCIAWYAEGGVHKENICLASRKAINLGL